MPNVAIEEAGLASDASIGAVHDDAFIAAVQALGRGERVEGSMRFGLGTPDDPIFPGMHEAGAAVCGASVAAADAIVSGRVSHAFNPAGGLHHARRAEASGFCIYNDPAVAIAHVLMMKPDWRVMYIDVDVHHGDGVQWIFYEDPRVLTVSLHQSGRYLYPGTGFPDETGEGPAHGTAINVPLPPYTGDDEYIPALERTTGAAAEAFRPDLIVTQLGADTHHGDPLANLSLTMRAYPRMAKILHDLAHSSGGRWLATGGGGYQATTVVPKVWTIYFAEMVGAPEKIPSSWLEDSIDGSPSMYREAIEAIVDEVLDECLPRLRELASA